MEIIKIENNEVVIAEEIIREFYQRQLDYMAAKNALEAFKEQFLENMEKFGVKSIDNDSFRITYVAPTKKIMKSVDYETLKNLDLYDVFVKETESETKASVRVLWK